MGLGNYAGAGAAGLAINIDVNADQANRAIGDVRQGLRDVRPAAREADAGLRDLERSANGSGSAWQSFTRATSVANEGIGKITAAVQIVGGALGALIGGGAIGGAITAAISAFGDLADIITDEEGRLRRNAEAVRLLKDVYSDFKSMLDQVIDKTKELAKAQQDGADDYARSLGIARDQLSAEGFLAGADEGEAAAKRRSRRAELETELKAARTELREAEQRRDAAEYQFQYDAAVGRMRFAEERLARAKAEYNALRRQIDQPPARSVGPGRVTPPAGPGWLSIDSFSPYADIWQNMNAYGPQDDPAARRRLAASEADMQRRIEQRADLDRSTAQALRQIEERNPLKAVAESATDYAGIAIGAAQQMAGAFGQSMSQLVISGEFGAAGLRRSFGRIVGGVSEIAFTYAALAAGLAAATAFTGPILGFSAPGLLAAAGILSGVGVAAGLTARLLGAGEASASAGRISASGSGGAAAVGPQSPIIPASARGGSVSNVYNISMAGAIVGRGAEDELHSMVAAAERRAQIQRGSTRIAA